MFIQCLDLQELDWSKWPDVAEVHLIVSLPVQQEIDKQKTLGQNSRVGRRARRTYSSLFRPIAIGDKEYQLIREADPPVKLFLESPSWPDPDLSDRLDYDSVDNKVVGCLHRYAKNNPNTDVRLLTHDTGPLMTARGLGLSVAPIEDDWLLPPESNDSERAIARLTAEVAQLKKAEPDFYIRCVDIAGKEVECIDLIHTIYDPLNEDDISEFIMILEERCPVSTDFNRKVPKPTLGLVEGVLGHRWYFEPPSEEAISKYKDQEYPEWLQDCRSMLSNIHEALQRKQGQPFFSFEVSNQGTRPGNDALVVISAKGNLEICPPPYEEDHPDDNDQRELSIPSPPSPPQGRWRSSRTSLNRLLGGLNSVGVSHPFEIPSLPVATYPPGEPRRDPNTFYYKPSRITEPSNTFSLECQQWRHGTEREAFEGYIFLAEDVTSVSGALECEIHAENLTKPARRTISVQIRLEHVSAKDSASDLVSPAGPPHSQSSHPGDERRELPPQAEPTGRRHALSQRFP